MLKRFFPRQEQFFDCFQKIADIILQAAQEFERLVNDLDNIQSHSDKIIEYEHDADRIVQEAVERLHKTFITPFDRNDIHELISGLDDILDLINHTSRSFRTYQLNSVPESINALAQLCIESAQVTQRAVADLDHLQKAEDILKCCDQIAALKSKAKQISLNGIEELFARETDFKQLIKLKGIYEQLLNVFKSYHSVTKIISGLVLEYS